MTDYKECVDKFVQSAKDLAGVVSDKTKQTASTIKIELDIKREEQELEKAYRAVGRVMYQIEMGTLKRDEQIVKAACQQVTAQEELLSQLRKEKEDIKARYSNGTVDVEGQEVHSEEETSEGQPQPEKNQDGYFVLKFCPYCKVGNHPDATKCASCGRDI